MTNSIFRRSIVQSLLWSSIWMAVLFTITYEWMWEINWLNKWIANLTLFTIIITININIILPYLYFKKRTGLYIISAMVLYLAVMSIVSIKGLNWMEALNPLPMRAIRQKMAENIAMFDSDIIPRFARHMNSPRRWISIMPSFLFGFFGSTVTELARFASIKERESDLIHNEQLLTEIKFLKAQINPHFLFNALNNIYTLIVTNSQGASDSLLQLSDMLRYMVYDCAAEKVELKKEVEYLNNYLNLVNLKDSKGLNIKTDIHIEYPNQKIPPLLFIPFVENAIKHSNIEDTSSGWIELSLNNDYKNIRFKISNSNSGKLYTKDLTGGIGLDNVKRRLDLAYNQQYKLEINNERGAYHIDLIIDIEKDV